MRISRIVLLALIAGLAIGGQASAGLINGGFEDPLGAEWTYVYVSGDATKWAYAAQGTRVHSGTQSLRMAYGNTGETGMAYMEQVVSGLVPDQGYQVAVWINMDWRASKATAYIEAVGGWGTVAAPGQGGNTDDVYQRWQVAQAADGDGNMTIRLYLHKYATTTGDKMAVAYYDDVDIYVPEPGSMIALLSGLVGLGAVARRRR